MTDYRPTPPAPPTQAWSEPTYDDQPGVKDRAGESLDQSKQAAGELASTVGEKAADVKDETVKQARDLVGEARGQLNQHAGEQHRNLVTNLRSLSSELHDMTQSSQTSGVATSLATQARGHVDTVADWLDQREPDQLVGELRGFARRRPGVFLVGALAAGIAAGRLTRGAIDSHSDDTSGSTQGLSNSLNGHVSPTLPPIAGGQPGANDLGLYTDPSQAFVPSTESDFGTRAPAGQPFDPSYANPGHPAPGFTEPAYQDASNSAPMPYADGETTRYDRTDYSAPVDETREFQHEEWRGEGSQR